jgi:CRP/FNR family transcriptional regulator, cyclic AMP receptor protein
MQSPNDHPVWHGRALLEATQTPFSVAGHQTRSVIFREGDPCDSVMHIEKGRVRLGVMARNGKEAICGLLGMGAFLGEEALAGQTVRRQTATAMTAVEVLVVAKAQMIRLLRTQPAVADRFIAHILARNIRLEADLTDQLLYSGEQRLARRLLVLADCDERHPRRCALPSVSQEIIAEMVGTTRSRVNAFMSKFKKLGWIEEAGGVLLVTPALLRVVHDGHGGVFTGATSLPQVATAEHGPWPTGGSTRSAHGRTAPSGYERSGRGRGYDDARGARPHGDALTRAWEGMV